LWLRRWRVRAPSVTPDLQVKRGGGNGKTPNLASFDDSLTTTGREARVESASRSGEYDDWTRRELPEKILARSRDRRRRAGDAIYDFDQDPPAAHKDAFHTEANRETDLGGRFALLFEHFYYFGGTPLELPEDLHPIIPTGREHQSTKNEPYVEPFEAWITSEFEANRLYGMPRGMPRSSERVTIGRKPG
jgi:Nucleotide modification associated domain 2